MGLYDLLAALGNRSQPQYVPPSFSEPTKSGSNATASSRAGKAPATARDAYVPSSPGAASDTGTYSFRRTARLDYSMTLQFDMATMTRTVQSLAEGDRQSVEQFAAAGFGLNADMAFSGSQTIETTGGNPAQPTDDPSHTRQSSFSAASTTTRTAYQSKQVAVQSFFREASAVRRSLDVKQHDNHSRVTNQLGMRFQLDSEFKFAQLNRFNVQTRQVAQSQPEAMPQYLNGVGEVGEKGSSTLMGSFFDAVESYLDQSESAMTTRASEFFDTATAELGFSGELVDSARDQLLGSIDSFFGRVDEAMSTLESQYAPQQMLAQQRQELAAQYYNPAFEQAKALLASV